MIKYCQWFIFRFHQHIENLKNILVSRTDGIGDVILTLPLIDACKECYPGTKIDFLINKNSAELLSGYSNINKVQVIENGRLREFLSIFKVGNYDAIILAKPEFNIALAAWLAKIPLRIGIAYRWYSFLFNRKHQQHRKYSIKHEAEYNLDLLKELGCNIQYKYKPKLNIETKTIDKIDDVLKKNNVNKKFIIIHIPTKGSAQSWSSANFITLINLLSGNETFNYTICLTGKGQDKDLLKQVFDTLQKKEKVRLIYDLSLIEFAAFIKLASLLVSNSTGTIHIAAAVDTFVIGLYPKVKAQSAVRWGPYTNKKKIFESKIEDSLESIKPDEVNNYILKTLT